MASQGEDVISYKPKKIACMQNTQMYEKETSKGYHIYYIRDSHG